MAGDTNLDGEQVIRHEAALVLSALAILPHASELRILMLPQDESWALPRIPAPMTDEVWELFELGMHGGSVLGCATETLYCPFYEHSTDEHGFRLAFVTHNLDAAFQAPDGARWVARDELATLTLADEYLRPVIEQYFDERISGIYPPERPPWGFAGWSQRARVWIEVQVEAQGWRLTGAIELVRKWCITCVMKVPTSAGDLYFKAVPPTFAREVGVTRLLAEQQPENIPTIVAAHEEERWLLLHDFGQAALGESPNAADWERALRDFAALQVQMTGQVDALLACGALDYRPETLPEKLDALLADKTMLKPDRHMTAEDIERVRRLAPRIKAMIAELDGYDLPATVVHGDFHVWNVAVQGERIIFFDWTDAAVGHPFFDMALVFGSMMQTDAFSKQPETVAQMREVYLQELVLLAPIETLRKALPLGEMVGMVHQAVNYRHLLRSVEPAERWTLDHIGYQMKKLLRMLEEAVGE